MIFILLLLLWRIRNFIKTMMMIGNHDKKTSSPPDPFNNIRTILYLNNIRIQDYLAWRTGLDCTGLLQIFEVLFFPSPSLPSHYYYRFIQCFFHWKNTTTQSCVDDVVTWYRTVVIFRFSFLICSIHTVPVRINSRVVVIQTIIWNLLLLLFLQSICICINV